MCSWCWGFRETWQQIKFELKDKVFIQYVLGGLAADNNQPMAVAMQQSIMDNWRRIQKEIPETVFNYDFWRLCQPRRSTYPACRAILAAGLQSESSKETMLLAIQQAYYLEAKNPSDNSVLIELATEKGLDSKRFKRDLVSQECEKLLNDELQLATHLHVTGFPSLVLSHHDVNNDIYINYTNSTAMIAEILELL